MATPIRKTAQADMRLAHVLGRRTAPLVISEEEVWDVPVPDINALREIQDATGSLAVFMGGEVVLADIHISLYICACQLPDFKEKYPTAEDLGTVVTIDNLDAFGNCLNELRTPPTAELQDGQEAAKEGTEGDTFQG